LLPLAACDSGLPEGVWLNMYDKDDRIVVTSSTEAKVTALFGQPLDAWLQTTPSQSNFGQQIADAKRALAVFELVNVTYTVNSETGEVTFSSDTRGSRTVVFNGGDMMDDPRFTMRGYLLQKTK
tara:strand:- start:11 stop:382 length:372 start_codon:yes stop_codon:yes gene_type:complete